ncbi:uncharacterized protein SPPG_05206 [Spizellomyces punctatus DAOM BR117]|uniref:Uncharacterized protein n=1 Tax=Spizellomyces punctatus (strain DAOM BR117) TaxID=645134 RepID=A0A0L0HFC8_SPIPD|nr:uncharacterized protein SPPG_05206 [Spizellomyces punctatus DAOM BR117]KNC99832.1 hypothetical protein SPPG_05206 [Spizellomyces punctatus DAOM BR117]|eukprot:XP_016607872.1 hypothetical protein SPPG_05206 [Spizellomyces punctatus DAOM BR117]
MIKNKDKLPALPAETQRFRKTNEKSGGQPRSKPPHALPKVHIARPPVVSSVSSKTNIVSGPKVVRRPPFATPVGKRLADAQNVKKEGKALLCAFNKKYTSVPIVSTGRRVRWPWKVAYARKRRQERHNKGVSSGYGRIDRRPPMSTLSGFWKTSTSHFISQIRLTAWAVTSADLVQAHQKAAYRNRKMAKENGKRALWMAGRARRRGDVEKELRWLIAHATQASPTPTHALISHMHFSLFWARQGNLHQALVSALCARDLVREMIQRLNGINGNDSKDLEDREWILETEAAVERVVTGLVHERMESVRRGLEGASLQFPS